MLDSWFRTHICTVQNECVLLCDHMLALDLSV